MILFLQNLFPDKETYTQNIVSNHNLQKIFITKSWDVVPSVLVAFTL